MTPPDFDKEASNLCNCGICCGMYEAKCRDAERIAAKLRELHRQWTEAEREACAQAVYDTEVVRIGRGYMETDDAQSSLNAAERAIRARGKP